MENMNNRTGFKDETFHQYHRKYAIELHKLFPEKCSLNETIKMGLPYKIGEKNKALLYDYYQHIEMEDILSPARKLRLLMLLGKLAEMLHEKAFNQLTKEDIQELVRKVRQRNGWGKTTQNYHLKALKKYLKHLNGGEHYPG
jgi:hypothetical protein